MRSLDLGSLVVLVLLVLSLGAAPWTVDGQCDDGLVKAEAEPETGEDSCGMSGQLQYPDAIEPIIPMWARRKKGVWGGGGGGGGEQSSGAADDFSVDAKKKKNKRPKPNILALANPAAGLLLLSLVWLSGRRSGRRSGAGAWDGPRPKTRREVSGGGGEAGVASSRAEIVAGRLGKGRRSERSKGWEEAVCVEALEATQAHLMLVDDDAILEELKSGMAADAVIFAAVEALVGGKKRGGAVAEGKAVVGSSVLEVGVDDAASDVGRRIEAVVLKAVEKTVEFVERNCVDLVDMARGQAPGRVSRAVEVGVRVSLGDLHSALLKDHKTQGLDLNWRASVDRGVQVALAELMAAREGVRRGQEVCEREAEAVKLAVLRGIYAAVSMGAVDDKRSAERVAGEAARRCMQVLYARADDGGALGLAVEELTDAAAFAAVDDLLERGRSAGTAEQAAAHRAAEHAEALEASGMSFSSSTALRFAADAVSWALDKAKSTLAKDREDRRGLIDLVRAPARDHAAKAVEGLHAAAAANGNGAAAGPASAAPAPRASLTLASGIPLLRAARYFCATYLRVYYERRGRAEESSREQEAASVIQGRFRSHADHKNKQQEMAMRDAMAIKKSRQKRAEEARIKTIMAVKIQARFRGRAARARANVLAGKHEVQHNAGQEQRERQHFASSSAERTRGNKDKDATMVAA